MRSGSVCLLVMMLAMGIPAQAEETNGSASQMVPVPSAANHVSDLQQRLAESERQRLAQQLKETQGGALTRWLTEQQQWFVTGGAVALIALLCGIFASGGHRRRRQWLN